MKVRVLTGLISAALAPLILTACGGGDSTGTNNGPPAFMSKVGDDPTYVIAGASFSDSIRVRVTDGTNKPASGASVNFAVSAGGGSVTPATVIADANGSAAAKFITGATPGANIATATVSGVTAITFSITTVTAGTFVWSSIPMDTLRGVWGTSASDVWAAGQNGAIVHYNGTSWSSVSSPTSQGLVSVWAASASDVWAVGYSGAIVHYNGTSWSNVPSGTTQDLFGIWGSSGTDMWAVGTAGLLHGVAAR